MIRFHPLTCCQALILLWYLLLSAVHAAAVSSDERVVAEAFVLQQHYGAACLETTTSELDAGTCVHQDPDDSSQCYPRNRTTLVSCHSEKPQQLWTYDFTKKKLHSKAYPDSMCLSRMVESVELLPCQNNIPGQLWLFDDSGVLSSAVDKDDRGSYLHLLKGDNVVIQPLQFKYFYHGQWQCYLSPASGQKICGQSEFGDNVVWQPETDKDKDKDKDKETGTEPGDDKDKDEDKNKNKDKDKDKEQPSPPVPVVWEDKPDFYWVSNRLTRDIRLSVRESTSCLGLSLPEACETGLVKGEPCYAGANVVVKTCEGDDRIWRHDLVNKRLFNKLAGYSYCLTWLNQKLALQSCFAGGAVHQKWYFAHEETRKPEEYKRLRFFSLPKSYDYLKFLKAPELPSWQSFEVEFSLVPRSSPDESCGYDPLIGTPLDECP
ncbi:ricin-type beta-trefoil lectin domain protein [Endozoicomonas montiporae]|nr:ricin-type beta-trefoil lectin domain protein [Endozoicomonas montiporae]AMO57798.1 hypothetical protein EZMO1_3856 [Endozoicomonas montiporae CL-33]